MDNKRYTQKRKRQDARKEARNEETSGDGQKCAQRLFVILSFFKGGGGKVGGARGVVAEGYDASPPRYSTLVRPIAPADGGN